MELEIIPAAEVVDKPYLNTQCQYQMIGLGFVLFGILNDKNVLFLEELKTLN